MQLKLGSCNRVAPSALQLCSDALIYVRIYDESYQLGHGSGGFLVPANYAPPLERVVDLLVFDFVSVSEFLPAIWFLCQLSYQLCGNSRSSDDRSAAQSLRIDLDVFELGQLSGSPAAAVKLVCDSPQIPLVGLELLPTAVAHVVTGLVGFNDQTPARSRKRSVR